MGRPAFPYRVTAVIPHRDTPDLLRLCIRFLERQTERPYIMVVDTGSRDELLHGVLAMRGEGIEVHQISCHGHDQAVASVSYAMDLALAACRTEWLWCLHSDCFMTNREALTVMLSRAEGGANPVVGYELPPSHNGDQRGMISHTCTLFHVPTLDRLNVTWSMRRFARQENDANGHLPPSPETVVNHRLHDAGVTPVLLGSERAHGVEIDAHRVHLRAATARRVGLAKEAGDEAAERSIVDWLARLSDSDDGAPDAAPPPGIVAEALRPAAADSARRPAVWTSAEAGARGRPEQTDTICLARGQPILFKHGLGDAVTFAHSIPLYTARGHAVRIACAADKEIIFRAAGAEIVDESEARFIHAYPYPEKIPQVMPRDWLPFNKLWHSVAHPPMPDIGRDRSLWQEYCAVRLDFDPFVPQGARESVDEFLGRLARPLIVFHPQGGPPIQRRSLCADVALTFCRRLLSGTLGSIVALDWAGKQGSKEWNGEIPLVEHPRMVSMRRDWKSLDVAELYWLLTRADIFVGIDSGPAHLLRFTDTRGIVCWTRQLPAFGVPAYCALPRPRTVNIIPCTVRPADLAYRTAYNLTESPGGELLDGDFIADQLIALLNGGHSCRDV